MKPQKNYRITLLALLLLAGILTALLVAAMREVLLTAYFRPYDFQTPRATVLITFIAVFAVGGIPAVVTTWIASIPLSVRSVGRVFTVAALGNVTSLIPGIFVLRALIWDHSDWLLTTFSLFGAGVLAFALSLTIDDYLRRRVAPQVAEVEN